MAAAQALSVVTQIERLASGQRSDEMRACLGQVVASLQHFLEHPEAQVRVNSARTLGKLARGYPEELRAQDLGKAKHALEVSAAAAEKGDSDAEAQRALLEDALVSLGLVESRRGGNDTGAASSTSGAPGWGESSTASPERNQRGEVCLKVLDRTDAHAKGGVLEALVAIPGVVSVTFEGPFVVVSTRTAANAVDVVFRGELLAAVRSQGLTVTIEEHASAQATSSLDDACEEIAYVDDEAEGEPAYLDDDDDDLPPVANGHAGGDGGGGPPGNSNYPHWSFFSQTNWMTGRRVYEYGDDPTIAARLARAKKADEERKKAQKTGFSRLFSMLTG